MAVEVLVEAKYDIRLGTWNPVLAWGFETGQLIQVMAVPGAEALAMERQQALYFARGRGFTEDEIWEYWCNNGGNGYTGLITQVAERSEAGVIPAMEAVLRENLGQ